MLRPLANATTLRLVHADRGPDATPSPGRHADAAPGRSPGDHPIPRATPRAIRAENRAASGLTPDDARLITARLAADAIEGGRAAIIRPEVRRRLVAAATGMGLRPFDANLVIAIVQDDARSSPDTARRRAGVVYRMSGAASGRLTMIRPAPHERALAPVPALIASVLLGLAAALLVVRWITGA